MYLYATYKSFFLGVTSTTADGSEIRRENHLGWCQSLVDTIYQLVSLISSINHIWGSIPMYKVHQSTNLQPATVKPTPHVKPTVYPMYLNKII